MHTINVLTLFPEMLTEYFEKALAGKALEKGLWKLNVINFRDYAEDVHGTVDDTPYGGGAGMVIKCDVIEKAIINNSLQNTKFYFMSPRGKTFIKHSTEQLPLTRISGIGICRVPRILLGCSRILVCRHKT